MPDDISENESGAPEAGAENSSTSKATSMLKGLQNFNVADFVKGKPGQWQKMGVVAVIVIVVMGLGAIMMWGLALWALANSFGDPSGSYGNGGISSLTFPASAASTESINCLDNWLSNRKNDSPLNGKASTMVSAGQTYNVNPAFILAIAGVESTYGTNWNLNRPESKNYQNMKCETGQRTTPGTECLGNWAKYPTWEKSIEEHNKYIRSYYLDNNKDTVEAIGNVYTESGSGEWAKTVNGVMKEIATSCPAFSAPTFSGQTFNGNLIVLDPGHKSNYNIFAQSANGVSSEGDHNWLIANKVKRNLEAKGYTVLLTKNSVDEDPSLPTRVNFANTRNASFFLSIHSNASGGVGPIAIVYCDGSANGKVDYQPDSCANSTNTKYGRDVARAILKNLITDLNLTNPKYWGGDLGVLSGLNMPNALIEMFAHDQTSDLSKIDGKSDQLAQSISDGITQVVKLNNK